MTVKVAINGFGRIGRITFRKLMEKSTLEVSAINDLTDVDTLAYLLKYDSVHGRFNGSVETNNDHLVVNGQTIPVYSEKDPQNLPWQDHEIDVVLESTGLFTKKEQAELHVKAGAKRVIISAPAKGDKQEISTIVMGVNDDTLDQKSRIISNASCTTNCLAPMVKVLDDNWGIENGFMTTVHAYTANQHLQDGPSKDRRRSRAAAQNIIPTSTGAADAIGDVMPHLDGKLTGMAMRIPVIDGSITDFNCTLKTTPSAEELNKVFAQDAKNKLSGIMEYTEDEIVSADIVGNPHSCIFDAPSTSIIGNLVKTIGWYDNEMGYSARCADLMEKLGKAMKVSNA